MDLWSDFLQGELPYQGFWLPLAIGMAAGTFCLYVGNVVWRSKQPKAPRQQAPVAPKHDPFVQGSLTDKRKSLRRSGNPVQVRYALPANKEATRRALVLDRSIGGLRLGTEEEIAAGTRLVVLPVNVRGQIPWVEIDVCTCKPVDDYWELGCRFVKTPPWSILLLFG